MKTIITLILFLSSASLAHAEVYPILGTYKNLAQKLLNAAQAITSTSDLSTVKQDTRALISLGGEIMDLYAEKNPNCKAQFKVFLQEVPNMEKMSLEALHERYHDGKGLPAAPKHCYFGRSQVIHPVMNLVRLHSPITADSKEEIEHEFDEVIEHLVRIQKNLDTPPN